MHYLSLTGVVGTSPDLDTTNWVVLPFSTANSYLLELDFIIYSLINSNDPAVLSRTDRRGNYIEDATFKASTSNFNNFQFGNDLVYKNTVNSGGFCFNKNSLGSFNSNIVTSEAKVSLDNYLGIIKSCSFSNQSLLDVDETLCTKNITRLNLENRELKLKNDTSLIVLDFNGKSFTDYNSSIGCTLDLSDVSIFNAGTLLIPDYLGCCGIFTLKDSNLTITKISGQQMKKDLDSYILKQKNLRWIIPNV
jgi:hypothetical protein